VVSLAQRQRHAIGARHATRDRRALLVALPALLLPFVIRSAVIEGVATATEVSTIGIAYSFIVGALVYRKLQWNQLGRVLIQSASLSGAILIVVGAPRRWHGRSRNRILAIARRSHQRHAGRQFTFIALSILLFAVLGCVLEGLPAVVLFAPLMFPIAKQFGVSEVHYSMIAILAMGSACSHRPSVSASTSPARSAAPIPTRPSGTSGSTSACCCSA
jgi:TRAP-type C4-dicarboxylate transport system permease large subunit